MHGIELSPATPADSGTLASMTFPSYRHLLGFETQVRHPELGEEERVQPFGVVARKAEQIVGLALAEEPLQGSKPTQLLSVYVLSDSRRQGIASALIQAVQDETKQRRHSELTAVYTTGQASIDWIETIFDRYGWDAPSPGSLVVRFSPEAALKSKALDGRRLKNCSKGLDIFPWQSITESEMNEIRRSDQEKRWVEPSLAPWSYDPKQLDSSSVGARYDGKVVGWVLNHNAFSGLVRFSVSYMHPDLSRRARILPLYRESLKRVQARPEPLVCTFVTPFTYPRMISFIQRWIVPFSDVCSESRSRRIEL